MYKLLTENQKKKISREYTQRRTVVMLSTLVVVMVIGLAGLFPSYLLSNVREREIKDRLEIVSKMELSEEDKELFSWLTEFNLKLKVLSPNASEDRPSIMFERITTLRGRGIKITNLDWLKENGKESITVSGIANDRKALADYERSLEDGGLGEATLPVSNLAKDKDIPFVLKLVPNQTATQ